MGKTYGRNARGNWVRSCDCCDEIGGVRERKCPHQVRMSSFRAIIPGERFSGPYCPAPALCADCYAKHKATLHAECAERAARVQAIEDALEAQIEAGIPLVSSAVGDWHAGIPAGKVGVTLWKRGAPEQYALIDAGEYRAVKDKALTAYPSAVLVPAW